MDITPPNLPATNINLAQPNNLREGVLVLRGLMNNALALPAGKSLWVELLSHIPLPTTLEQSLPQLAKKTVGPIPSNWQPLLIQQPLELIELKLPSGQKIWAVTLRAWFEVAVASSPPKTLLEVKTSKDGQLILPASTSGTLISNNSTSNKTNSNSLTSNNSSALTELWRKSLPTAQPPKQLMQLMTPLVKPLANLPTQSNHPLQPIQHFITQHTQRINTLLTLTQLPPTPITQQQTSQHVAQLISNSGVFLEAKLRNIVNKPESLNKEQLKEAAEVTTQDFKAQLLKSLVGINQQSPQLSETHTEWPEHLWHLFLGNKEETPSTPTKNSQWLLLEALLPSLQKTLAGIQLQQSHSLAEQEKNSGIRHFEIPLPSSEGWINLSAQITPANHHLVDDAESSAQQARAANASWRLLLEFNLPNNGLLAVQFLWQPGFVRGQVWANQAKLKQQLKDQLRTLKKSLLEGGINAEQLHITDEPITKPPLPIHHPLVDIQT